MANSFVRYTGNGNTTQYAVSFSYRDQADISVTIDGVATTAFTFNGAGTQITFNSAPANLSSIEIRRKTSQTSRLVDYAAGSVLTENDLDTDSNQGFFMSQEAIDDANDRIKLDNADFQWDAQSKRIKNVADPTGNQDVATKYYIENTWLSASDKATISAVNSNISNINAVNSNASNINSAVSNATNINTVATNIASVNTVATDIAKVITVANDLNETVSEIETAALDLQETTSEIDTVATNIANVNSVGNDIANVNTVAGISANVTTVAGISANVTTVATNNANVTSVAGNATNINTVAGAIANVNTVGGAIANVNTVASNVAGVNSFAERYRVASSAPGSSNDVGDLYFDTTANELKVYKSSGWAAAGSTVNGTAQRYTYNITGTPTTVTGADAKGATLAYDAGFIDVYLNGVRLSNSSGSYTGDVTVSSGTSVVFANALAAGDVVDIVAYGTFSVASIAASAITSGILPTARGGTGVGSLGSAGQALVVNGAGNALEFANASSPEIYGFEKNASGQLIVTTTNEGADNISESTYASFEDVMFGASGMTWSISNGKLIATI